MDEIAIVIDSSIVPVDFVWVHLQSLDEAKAKDFTLTVPLMFAKDVFDPGGHRPQDKSIETDIQELVSEFGTFMLDGYLNNIRRLLRSEWLLRRFLWVVATVEKIENDGNAIVIRGKAVPFIRGTSISSSLPFGSGVQERL